MAESSSASAPCVPLTVIVPADRGSVRVGNHAVEDVSLELVQKRLKEFLELRSCVELVNGAATGAASSRKTSVVSVFAEQEHYLKALSESIQDISIVLAGRPGAGKSLFCRDLVLHYCKGLDPQIVETLISSGGSLSSSVTFFPSCFVFGPRERDHRDHQSNATLKFSCFELQLNEEKETFLGVPVDEFFGNGDADFIAKVNALYSLCLSRMKEKRYFFRIRFFTDLTGVSDRYSVSVWDLPGLPDDSDYRSSNGDILVGSIASKMRKEFWKFSSFRRRDEANDEVPRCNAVFFFVRSRSDVLAKDTTAPAVGSILCPAEGCSPEIYVVYSADPGKHSDEELQRARSRLLYFIEAEFGLNPTIPDDLLEEPGESEYDALGVGTSSLPHNGRLDSDLYATNYLNGERAAADRRVLLYVRDDASRPGVMQEWDSFVLNIAKRQDFVRYFEFLKKLQFALDSISKNVKTARSSEKKQQKQLIESGKRRAVTFSTWAMACFPEKPWMIWEESMNLALSWARGSTVPANHFFLGDAQVLNELPPEFIPFVHSIRTSPLKIWFALQFVYSNLLERATELEFRFSSTRHFANCVQSLHCVPFLMLGAFGTKGDSDTFDALFTFLPQAVGGAMPDVKDVAKKSYEGPDALFLECPDVVESVLRLTVSQYAVSLMSFCTNDSRDPEGEFIVSSLDILADVKSKVSAELPNLDFDLTIVEPLVYMTISLLDSCFNPGIREALGAWVDTSVAGAPNGDDYGPVQRLYSNVGALSKSVFCEVVTKKQISSSLQSPGDRMRSRHQVPRRMEHPGRTLHLPKLPAGPQLATAASLQASGQMTFSRTCKVWAKYADCEIERNPIVTDDNAARNPVKTIRMPVDNGSATLLRVRITADASLVCHIQIPDVILNNVSKSKLPPVLIPSRPKEKRKRNFHLKSFSMKEDGSGPDAVLFVCVDRCYEELFAQEILHGKDAGAETRAAAAAGWIALVVWEASIEADIKLGMGRVRTLIQIFAEYLNVPFFATVDDDIETVLEGFIDWAPPTSPIDPTNILRCCTFLRDTLLMERRRVYENPSDLLEILGKMELRMQVLQNAIPGEDGANALWALLNNPKKIVSRPDEFLALISETAEAAALKERLRQLLLERAAGQASVFCSKQGAAVNQTRTYLCKPGRVTHKVSLARQKFVMHATESIRGIYHVSRDVLFSAPLNRDSERTLVRCREVVGKARGDWRFTESGRQCLHLGYGGVEDYHHVWKLLKNSVSGFEVFLFRVLEFSQSSAIPTTEPNEDFGARTAAIQPDIGFGSGAGLPIAISDRHDDGSRPMEITQSTTPIVAVTHSRKRKLSNGNDSRIRKK
eukprot:c6953_g1_i1.p1 GENE.c6953_g1_i1~~c6953_g1_i1.p1  ORF type:complete len:1342 (+),score=125.73 c6953_g1_i1:91-4116(+)